MYKIGIFGGTFNPVHNEHVNIAKNAVEELNLDTLYVMPTFISPHKSSVPASETDRLNMLKLAFRGTDKIKVSDYEILKGGKSYTYLTVEHFKEKYDCELYFICGGDMLVDFKTWKNPDRILNACNLAVFDRKDFNVDYPSERTYFSDTFNKSFIKLNYIGKEDSSTKIRIYSSFGLDITAFTPKNVAEYIKENNLYKPDTYTEFAKDNLTEKRLIHTANVVVTALSMAKRNNLDPEKVRISATLHDCAKYLDYKKYPGFVMDGELKAPVVHAFLGAYIAENVLKITDSEIIDAIKYHTSGRPEMSDLEKLIFVADMVCEDRDYEGVEKLRYYFNNYDLNTCFKECLKEEMIHLKNKKTDIYNLTLSAYNYYIEGKD